MRSFTTTELGDFQTSCSGSRQGSGAATRDEERADVGVSPGMSPSEAERTTALLQQAADCVCVNAPDRVTVSLYDDQIRVAFTTWSPAMSRQAYERHIYLEDIDQYLVDPDSHPTWRSRALPLMKNVLDGTATIQTARQECARRLGLLKRGACRQLDPYRIMIDRSILRMFDDAGIDVLGQVMMASRSGWRAIDPTHLERIEVNVEEPRISIVQHETATPVVASLLPLGSGWYGGDRLIFHHFLPETIAVAAVGRCVGDVVITGDAPIDGRLIAGHESNDEAVVEDGDLVRFTQTTLFLEPDLVEIGGQPSLDLFGD